MANEAQNLGLQQVPETDVRSGGQIASSIASSAASGASAGSVLAPWGTVVGAVVGGGIAAIGQLKGKKREENDSMITLKEWVIHTEESLKSK